MPVPCGNGWRTILRPRASMRIKAGDSARRVCAGFLFPAAGRSAQPKEPLTTADAWCIDQSSPDKSGTPSLIEETPPAGEGFRRSPFVYRCALLHPGDGNRHILCAAWFSARMACRCSDGVTPISPSDALWSQLFQKERDTFVVPADSGLVIMQGLTRHPVSLGDYVSGKYQSDGTSHAAISAGDVRELGPGVIPASSISISSCVYPA